MHRLHIAARTLKPFALAVIAAAALQLSACSKNTTDPNANATASVATPGKKGEPASTDTKATEDRSGQPANFAFKVQDMNGATVDLASYKGRPLVVNFWATWCPPCKLEIPWFIEFKKQYGAQGLEILGVSIDDPAPELKKYAAEHQMNYPVLIGLNQDKFVEAYDAVVTIPVTWFIKKDGTVQGRNIGINTREFFENQIKALF